VVTAFASAPVGPLADMLYAITRPPAPPVDKKRERARAQAEAKAAAASAASFVPKGMVNYRRERWDVRFEPEASK
jgi:hypothetical protein